MKSKTSYFNGTLFRNLLKRYWPLFAGYLIIWLIILPIPLANNIQYHLTISDYNDDIRVLAAIIGNQMLKAGHYGGVIISGIFGMIIAMAAFSYLYNSRSVSMMCSLPIKREGVFLSEFTSGLSAMLVSNVFVFLITLCVVSAHGLASVTAGYLLQWLAMVCMMNLFFFGFAALCASFTGNVIVLPLVYLVLNFTVYVVEMLFKVTMGKIVYGMVPGDSVLAAFSPPVDLYLYTSSDSITEALSDGSEIAIGYSYNGWAILAVYAVVGLIFAALAMLLIKRRRMETAGDVVALRPLKPVFKYCLSFGCALVIGILIYQISFGGTNAVYGVKAALFLLSFMLFGAFIGYFAAEMLMQKTFRVFTGRKWIGMGVTALVLVFIVLGSEFDIFGVERKLPDPDELESVTVSCYDTVIFEDPDNIEAAIKAQSDIISHKDESEECASKGNERCYGAHFLYTYKNGKTLTRNYQIYTNASDDIYTLNDLMNTKEAVDYRKALRVPASVYTITGAYIGYMDKTDGDHKGIQLTSDQAYELYSECVLPDIDDGTLGKVWIVTDDDYNNNVYNCTFSFSVQKRQLDGTYMGDSFSTTLTKASVRTDKWVEENLGIELVTMGESEKMNDNEKYAYESEAAYIN